MRLCYDTTAECCGHPYQKKMLTQCLMGDRSAVLSMDLSLIEKQMCARLCSFFRCCWSGCWRSASMASETLYFCRIKFFWANQTNSSYLDLIKDSCSDKRRDCLLRWQWLDSAAFTRSAPYKLGATTNQTYRWELHLYGPKYIRVSYDAVATSQNNGCNIFRQQLQQWRTQDS